MKVKKLYTETDIINGYDPARLRAALAMCGYPVNAKALAEIIGRGAAYAKNRMSDGEFTRLELYKLYTELKMTPGEFIRAFLYIEESE